MATKPRSGFAPAAIGSKPTFQGFEFARVDSPRVQRAEATPPEVKDAEAAGLARGLAAGREAARAEIDNLKARMNKALGDLSLARTRLEEDQAARVALIVQTICRRILGVELRTNPDVITHWVTTGLERVAPDEPVEVHVNPDDRDWLADGVIDDMKLVIDPDVPRGGCSIVSRSQVTDIDPLGMLDAIFENEAPCTPSTR